MGFPLFDFPLASSSPLTGLELLCCLGTGGCLSEKDVVPAPRSGGGAVCEAPRAPPLLHILTSPAAAPTVYHALLSVHGPGIDPTWTPGGREVPSGVERAGWAGLVSTADVRAEFAL